MTNQTEPTLDAVCEAVLFISPRPLSAKSLAEITDQPEKAVRAALNSLRERYRRAPGALEVQEAGGKFQLVTRRELAPYLDKVADRPKAITLSQAAMETLAAVAYYGPVTRAEIEAFRGVNSEGALATLVERSLVRETGRKEAPGRPYLYAVTGDFFQRFGLKDLGDLRRLVENPQNKQEEIQLSFQA